jgi:hypothetical protein
MEISGRVAARASRAYAGIAGYREQHPHIVPSKYFPRLEVLEGGVGAGTRTRVKMCLLGSTRVFEQLVMEPEPGRVIIESNQDGSGLTTFPGRRIRTGHDRNGPGLSAPALLATSSALCYR